MSSSLAPAPQGLAAACRLKQVNAELIRLCGGERLRSGRAYLCPVPCFEPTPLNELFPDWKELGAPSADASG